MPPSTSPDPIAEPAAYQDLLIGLVGDDDPADVQAGTPSQLRALVAEAGPLLDRSPAPGEWSALECVAHITDAEVVYSGRYRWILAHDEPDLPGYDQDRWVDRLHRPLEAFDELLALFEPLRAANLALWQRTPAELRERVGMHRERGPESFRLSFTLVAGHDRFHLAQARRAVAAAREG